MGRMKNLSDRGRAGLSAFRSTFIVAVVFATAQIGVLEPSCRIVGDKTVIYGFGRFDGFFAQAFSPPSPLSRVARFSTRSTLLFGSSSPSTDEAPPSSTKPPLKIAIVGSGAVGSYYGARLWEAHKDSGAQVMFHLRNEHYDHCTKHGMDVKSIFGGIVLPPEELSAHRTTEDMAQAITREDEGSGDGDGGKAAFDWVVCALKSTALEAVPELVEPLLSPSTRLLVIMNGLIEEDLLTFMKERWEKTSREMEGAEKQSLGCAAVYGGMALICSNRLSPGVVEHTYAGKLVAGVAYSAEAEKNSADSELQGEGSGANNKADDWTESDREAILSLFAPLQQTVPFAFEPNLRRGRWWKNVWNLPFNGISVAMGGITVDRIVNDPGLRQLAYGVIDETLATANADLRSRGVAEDELLGEEAKDEMMTLSDGMGPYKPSTMLDMHARKPMEVRYLFRRAIDRADELGVPVVKLETLVSMIEAHQQHYGL